MTIKQRADLINATLLDIAGEHLGLRTLETRNSDSLDFVEVAVWNVKAALEAAFKAGQELVGCNPNSACIGRGAN